MILIRDDLEFELMNIDTDTNGRYIFLEAIVQGCLLLLVNIYAPNTLNQQDHFFSLLSNKMEEYDFRPERNVIMGGDFNLYFDVDMDCCGGNPQLKSSSIEKAKDVMLKGDLIDIWRIRHPNTRRFTWRQKTPPIQRRLDFWFISDSLQEDIDVVNIFSEGLRNILFLKDTPHISLNRFLLTFLFQYSLKTLNTPPLSCHFLESTNHYRIF